MNGADMATAPTDPTRDGAFDLLTAVLTRRRALDDALDSLAARDPRDRAAAHRLAAAVLRHAGSLDAVLEPFLRRAPPDAVRQVLRLGAAQALLLETPAHAAVATSVALARSHGLDAFAGLVNAVLRRVTEHGAAALAELDMPRLDTPAWLWASWGAEARAIARAHAAEAPLDLTVRGVAPPGGQVLPTGSVRYAAGTRVSDLAGFAEGAFWVQDAAASLPARLLAPQPGEVVADLCAAPGGKTAQLAAAGARVFAVDQSAHRMARLQDNLARLQLEVTTVLADATAWQPPALLDAVLLDAPCSATGTIRRHPDIPHIKRPQDVTAMAVQQHALLAAAAGMLRPGGRLVYAVCSLQPEEGAGILPIAGRLGLRVDPFGAAELPGLAEARTADGAVRTHPGMWPEWGGMDGFYCVRLRKA